MKDNVLGEVAELIHHRERLLLRKGRPAPKEVSRQRLDPAWHGAKIASDLNDEDSRKGGKLSFVSVALNTLADISVACAAGGIRTGVAARPDLIRDHVGRFDEEKPSGDILAEVITCGAGEGAKPKEEGLSKWQNAWRAARPS